MKIRNKQKNKPTKSYKFGHKIPPITRIDMTLKFDKESGKNKWKDSMNLKI